MSCAQNSHSLIEILLVEDDPVDVRLIQRMFKKGGVEHNLHVVYDGADALEFVRQEGKFANSPRPDIVLLDLNMPRKDGSEVLIEMKEDEDLMRIPVVVVSTSTFDRDIRPITAKADCYITKPVTLDKFSWLVEARCSSKR